MKKYTVIFQNTELFFKTYGNFRQWFNTLQANNFNRYDFEAVTPYKYKIVKRF